MTASSGAGAPGATRSDTVAAVVRQWQSVHPDLDTGPMEIIGRINRSAALLQQAEDAPLRRAGLSRPEFDLLGALRRTGHELTPANWPARPSPPAPPSPSASRPSPNAAWSSAAATPATAASPTSVSRTPGATWSTASCPSNWPMRPPCCRSWTPPSRTNWRNCSPGC